MAALAVSQELLPATPDAPIPFQGVCAAPNALAERVSPAAAQMDESLREKLLLEHLPQVQYIARRIHDRVPPQVLLEDLVHAGILGLMDAIKKYDPRKNVQLKHYAEFRIRGAILDSLRQVDWSPRTLRRQARRLEQAISECKGKFKRDPTEPEIAVQLGMSLKSLQHLLGDLRGLDVGSLQAERSELGYWEESLRYRPGSEEEDPYHQTLRSEMTTLLGRAVHELPQREQEVLALYHYEELTMKEVGTALGVGESRVSQIHTTALVRLRARLHELLDSGPMKARSISHAPRTSATIPPIKEGAVVIFGKDRLKVLLRTSSSGQASRPATKFNRPARLEPR